MKESIKAVVTRTAEQHGFTYGDIVGPSRKPPVAAVRRLAILAAFSTGRSQSDIARAMGCSMSLVNKVVLGKLETKAQVAA